MRSRSLPEPSSRSTITRTWVERVRVCPQTKYIFRFVSAPRSAAFGTRTINRGSGLSLGLTERSAMHAHYGRRVAAARCRRLASCSERRWPRSHIPPPWRCNSVFKQLGAKASQRFAECRVDVPEAVSAEWSQKAAKPWLDHCRIASFHNSQPVLRQNPVDARCVDTFLRDVALFLPFRCHK